MRTSGSRASSGASGRCVPDRAQDVSSDSARRPVHRRRSRADSTTTSNATVPSASLWTLLPTTVLKTPSTTPPAKARGRYSIFATMAAARAGRNRPPVDTNGLAGRPFVGAFRTSTAAPSAPTSIHTSRDRRRTGMPRSMARSVFSAIDRTAVPESVRSRNHDSPASTMGAEREGHEVVGRQRRRPDHRAVLGQARGEPRHEQRSPCPEDATANCRPTKIWSNPTVATVTTSRGALPKRRSTRSTPAPRGPRRRWPSSTLSSHGTCTAGRR